MTYVQKLAVLEDAVEAVASDNEATIETRIDDLTEVGETIALRIKQLDNDEVDET